MTQGYERHALSRAFPDASEADFEILVRSIQERGFDPRHPITLYEGAILDGWHRYLACKKVGVDPPFETFEGSAEDARELIFSENLARRQLTIPQKITAFLLHNAFLPPDKQLNDVEIAARVGKSSLQGVRQLRKLAEKSPEVAEAVAAGDVPAAEAVREELREEPVGGKSNAEERRFITLTARQAKRFSAARKSLGWTSPKATNKAVELFEEWVRAELEGQGAEAA